MAASINSNPNTGSPLGAQLDHFSSSPPDVASSDGMRCVFSGMFRLAERIYGICSSAVYRMQCIGSNSCIRLRLVFYMTQFFIRHSSVFHTTQVLYDTAHFLLSTVKPPEGSSFNSFRSYLDVPKVFRIFSTSSTNWGAVSDFHNQLEITLLQNLTVQQNVCIHIYMCVYI